MTRELEVELPDGAAPVALPHAQVMSAHAGELATRWTMRLTFLLLLALTALCIVGPHIPSGD